MRRSFIPLLIVIPLIYMSCFFPGRKKEAIYAGFFGKPANSCVRILEARDARATDDCCVWIHFQSCAAETRRILSQTDYKVKPMSKKWMQLEFPDPATIDESLIGNDPPKWWTLKKLGDTCLKFEHFDTGKDYAQFLYMSIDSTEIFYHDASW